MVSTCPVCDTNHYQDTSGGFDPCHVCGYSPLYSSSPLVDLRKEYSLRRTISFQSLSLGESKEVSVKGEIYTITRNR
jgi:hypothetical protein